MDHQLHSADAHCTEFEPPDVQHVESNLVSFTNFAEQVLDRSAHVGKHESRRARTLDTHLVLFSARSKTWLALDDKCAELVAIDFRKHDEDVCETAVRDPH